MSVEVREVVCEFVVELGGGMACVDIAIEVE